MILRLLTLGLLLWAPLLTGQPVTLAWDPSVTTNVVGYRVHYGFTNGVYPLTVEAGPSTNVTINLPVAGTRYHFVATAYDEMGRESDYSEGVSYTTSGESPTLVVQPLETTEDEPIALPWGAETGYSSDATWLVALPAGRGALTDENGRPVYVPFEDTSGTDEFVYYVLDGNRSYQVIASLLVQPVNDPPWAWDFDVQTELNSPVAVTLGGWDPDGDALSFEVIASPQHGLLQGEGPEWTYEPLTGFSGLDSFRYVAKDGATNSPPATGWIWVGMPDGTPAAFDLEVATAEDQAIAVELQGRDSDGDPLSFEIVVFPEHGTLVGEGGTWSYAPHPDFHGADEFWYRASDGGSASAAATVRIVVASVNDRPVAQDLDLGTDEDAALEITPAAADADGDALTFEVSTPPQHGALHWEGGGWIYEPQPDFHGTDAFQYVASDGVLDSQPATVRILVTPVNDPPVARSMELSTDEDHALDVTLEGGDVDGDVLSYEILALPQHGTLRGEGAQWVYEPQPDFHGNDQFSYRVSDGIIDSEPETVNIGVTPVNDPPVVLGVRYEVIEGIARDFVLKGEDPDGDPVTFQIAKQPAHGTLSGLLPQVRYEPEPGYTGNDRWEFMASDGVLDSPVGVVQIEVVPKAGYEITLNARAEDGQLWLSWGAVVGARYRLWHRMDLFQESWTVVQEIPAADPGQETVSVVVSEPAGYYRCEVVIY